MSKALIALGSLLVVVLAALFAVPQFVDWDRYRGNFEEEASRMLGRDVRVGGRVNLRLLPVPYLHFEKIRVADTAGPVGEPFFRADSLTVWLSLSPLLSGSMEASRAEVVRPVVNLVLDDKGSGNWATLVGARRSSSFLPAKVILDAVSIRDGRVNVHGADGTPRTSFDAITGTFSATDLEGPYKVQVEFKPGAAAGGPRAGARVHELRLSTSRADADGSVRVKGTVRAPDTEASYTLDAVAHDPLGAIRFEGAVAARIPVAPVAGRPAEAAKRPTMIEVKSSLIADTAAIELKDLALSFDSDGRPQMATGGMRMAWRGPTSAEILLDSRWLDLDRILGGASTTAPHAMITTLASLIDAALPETARTRAFMILDQATLGGEIVSGIRIGVEKQADRLGVTELSGNLPGGVRLSLTGALYSGHADKLFAGPVDIRGGSLARFLSWAARGTRAFELRRDGAFALSGHLQAAKTAISGRDLRVQFAGNSVGGAFSWAGGATPRVSLDLEGTALDLSGLIDHEPTIPLLVQGVMDRLAGAGTVAPKGSDGASRWPRSGDVRLRLAKLDIGGKTLNDVDLNLDWSEKGLSISRLRLKGPAGWSLDTAGQLPAAAGDKQQPGEMSGVLAVTTEAGLRELLMLADLAGAADVSSRRLQAIVPMRLAGRLMIGGSRLPPLSTALLTMDGALGGGRMVARLALGPTAGSWRQRAVELDARIDAPEITRLLTQVLPTSYAPRPGVAVRVPGRMAIGAVGTPASGLDLVASVDSAGLNLHMTGRGTLAEGPDGQERIGLAGVVRARADNLGHAFALTAFGRRPSLDGTAMTGTFDIGVDKGRLRLETGNLALGAAQMSGVLEAFADGDRLRVEGNLRASDVVVARALAPLLDERGADQPAGRETLAPSRTWPDQPFNMSVLDGIAARVRLTAPQLSFQDRLSLADVALDLQISEGALVVLVSEGRALGGKVTGRIRLTKVPAGAALAAEVQLADGRITPGEGAGQPVPVSGRVAMKLTLSGQALSPRGLIAQLSGRGALTLAGGQLNGISATATRTVGEAFIRRASAAPEGALDRQLREALQTAKVAIGQRRLALTVTNGAVRVEPIVVADGGGRVSGSTTVDMESLRIDSEWRIEMPPTSTTGDRRGAYPPLSVVWAGPLAQLAKLTPQLQLEAFERELNVRRMEQEVDNLERIRREDEERVRLEAERQRALAAERQRQIEEARRQEEEARARAVQPPPVTTVPQATPAPAGGAPQTDAAARPTPTPPVPTAAAPQPSQPAGQPAAPSTTQRATPPRPPPPPPQQKGYRPLDPNQVFRNFVQ